jgi:cytochrome c oxidase assembly protein subunit 11
VNPRARLTAFIAAGAAVGMLGLSFAAEPLYSKFCQLTGFGGTTQRGTVAATRVLDRMVRVRFDANTDPDAPLRFTPDQEFIDVKIGQTAMAYYTVTNLSDRPVRAQATYNVQPDKSGQYFNKLECFCFNERTFAPGHTERLPVVFFVKPEMDDDRQARDVDTITLSYTYFRVPEPPGSARLEDASAVN